MEGTKIFAKTLRCKFNIIFVKKKKKKSNAHLIPDGSSKNSVSTFVKQVSPVSKILNFLNFDSWLSIIQTAWHDLQCCTFCNPGSEFWLAFKRSKRLQTSILQLHTINKWKSKRKKTLRRSNHMASKVELQLLFTFWNRWRQTWCLQWKLLSSTVMKMFWSPNNTKKEQCVNNTGTKLCIN